MLAGGRLVFQYVKKRSSHPKCGATGVRLNGVCLLAKFLLIKSSMTQRLPITHLGPGGLEHCCLITEKTLASEPQRTGYGLRYALAFQLYGYDGERLDSQHFQNEAGGGFPLTNLLQAENGFQFLHTDIIMAVGERIASLLRVNLNSSGVSCFMLLAGQSSELLCLLAVEGTQTYEVGQALKAAQVSQQDLRRTP